MILKSNEIRKIEKILNYEFNNKELLEQAFIRESYAKEKRILGEKVYGNEQLELFGDGVLKYILIKNIEERFCSIEDGKLYSMNNEGTISSFVSHFSDKEMLSNNIERLGLHNFLIVNKGDQLQNAKNSINVKEDLFEALVGAIWIDCDKNITLMENKVLNMLNLETYVFQDYTDSKSKLFSWAKKKHIQINLEIVKEEDMFTVKCKLDEYNYLTLGKGKKIKTAEKNACQEMLKLLQENNLYEEDLVGEFDFDSAINKLQELSQKNIIGEIKYDQYYDYEENRWITMCNIRNFNCTFYSSDKLKIMSKKKVAYNILERISNEMDYERLSLYKKDKVFMVFENPKDDYHMEVGYIFKKNDRFFFCTTLDRSITIQSFHSNLNVTVAFKSMYDALVEYFKITRYYLDDFYLDESFIRSYFEEKIESSKIEFIDDIDKIRYLKKLVDELDCNDYHVYIKNNSVFLK